MTEEKGFLAFSRTERVAIGLSVIGLIMVVLFIFNDALFNRLFGTRESEDLSKPVMGYVSYKLNDTRHKKSNSHIWVGAKEEQRIRLGDSVFTGEESRSQVILKDGNEINLDQNTLVTFNQVSNLVDLSLGNFRLKVDGKLTLSVQGRVTTIEANNSDIQFIVSEEKPPQVRLLKGSAKLQSLGQKAFNLTPAKVEDAFLTDSERSLASASTVEPPRPVPGPTPATRYLKLYDVYERVSPFKLARRSGVSPETEIPSLEADVSLKTPAHTVKIGLLGDLLPLTVTESEHMDGYVIETSQDPGFPAEKTNVHWTHLKKPSLNLTSSGSFYYRIRGVNSKTEITKPSEPVQIMIERESDPRKLAPLVIRPPKPVSVRKQTPRKIVTRKAPSPEGTTKPAPPQPRKELVQNEPPVPLSPLREPSAAASSSLKIDLAPQSTNDSYTSSRFDIESGMFTVFSPDESTVGRTHPFAYMLGARSKHWFGKSGIEAIARVKAGGINETASGINPLQLEGRYHYALGSSLGLLGLGRTKTSLLTGIEVYRNIGNGYFAQQYDLAKLGFSIDFPMGLSWDAGGDLITGIGADSTRKYEALGRLNYYVRRRYSIGLGYRLHILEAGSNKTAPVKSPYTETYGEGFLILRWHYGAQ